MTSFHSVKDKIEKLENEMLPKKQTTVVVKDQITGIIHYNGESYADETELRKTLGDNQPTHILTVCVHPSLIAEGTP